MQKKYEIWTNSMMSSWKNLEGSKTAELFSKNVEYYETLDAPPCNTWEDVVKLWEIVPENQSNIKYEFNIICADDSCAVINWVMKRNFHMSDKVVNQYIDGIFQIKLDNDGKCCFFKQWRFMKVEE